MTSHDSWTNWFNQPRAVYATAVTLFAAVLLTASVARDVLPGDSARLVAQHAGVDVFAPLSHTVWGWIGSAFSALPIGSFGLRWNLLSAWSGAACCGMCVLLAARLPRLNPNWSVMVLSARPLANLAGTAAGLLLLGSLPLRTVSAAASPVTLELLGLLVAVWLLTRYAGRRRPVYAAGACALYSLVASQSPSALVLAPFFFIALLVLVWRNKHASARTIGKLFALLLVPGLLVMTLTAVLFRVHPCAEWVQLQRMSAIFYHMALDIYYELRFGSPLLTLMMLFLCGILPLVIIFSITRKSRERSVFTLPTMLGLAVFVFLSFRFSPFSFAGMRALIVYTYVLAAIWLGYLAAYYIGMIHAHSIAFTRSRRKKRKARILSGLGLAALTLFIVAVGLRSQYHLRLNAGMGVTRLAAAVAAQIPDDTWMIVYGEFDPLIRIKTHEYGRQPLIISAHRMTHPPYQRALAAAMPTPRLAAMVSVGLPPLLRERWHPDHAPVPQLAVLGEPGLLRVIDRPAWPDRVLYWSEEPPGLTPESYHESQRRWWRELPLPDAPHPYAKLDEQLRALTGRVANDAGIWLQDRDADELARDAYREAIRISPGNLSAHLNLRELLDAETEEAIGLDEAIEILSARYRDHLGLARIMDLHGRIRHDAATAVFMQRGGQSPADTPLNPALAELFEQTDDDVALTGLMRIANDNPVAVLNLARLANGLQRPGLARRMLNTLPLTGPLSNAVRIERAQAAMALDEPAAAREILYSIPDREIIDPRALILLALLTAETDPERCDGYLARLESFPGRLPQLSLVHL